MKNLFLSLAFTVLLSACGSTATVTIVSPNEESNVSVKVELAVTAEEQQRGLMGRAHLPDDEGMMFVFVEEGQRSFWMKNTLIPLQILYFDAKGQFVNALDMVPCEEEPCPSYHSASFAKYALEVNPGFREKHGIAVGWKLDQKTVSRLERAL